MDFASGGVTTNILEFLYYALPEMVEAGDRYVIFRLGIRNYDDARVLNEYSPTLKAPLIEPTSSPHPTLTSVQSTPTYTGQSLIQKTKNALEYNATLTPHYATATEMAFIEGCVKTDWERKNAAQIVEWEVTKVSARSIFITQIQTQIDLFKSRNIPTPYARDAILEGLTFASLVLENECKLYDSCSLLIFDELNDWRVNPSGVMILPSNITVNLANARIASILLNCTDIYSDPCRKLTANWTNIFKDFGAISVTYLSGNNLEHNLISFLGR